MLFRKRYDEFDEFGPVPDLPPRPAVLAGSALTIAPSGVAQISSSTITASVINTAPTAAKIELAPQGVKYYVENGSGEKVSISNMVDTAVITNQPDDYSTVKAWDGSILSTYAQPNYTMTMTLNDNGKEIWDLLTGGLNP